MLVDKNQLKSALSKLNVYIDKNSTLLFSRVQFKAENGMAQLTGTDGNNVGKVMFPVNSNESLEFTADSKQLISATYLRGDIEIQRQGSNLVFSNGDTRLVFPESEAFNIDEALLDKTGMTITINTTVLKNLINKVAYARNEKDGRAFATGLNLKLQNTVLTAIATDGIRLLRAQSKLNVDPELAFNIVLTPKGVQAIGCLDDDLDFEFSLIDNTAIGFKLPNLQAYVPCLNCNYPIEIEKFFTSNSSAEFTIEKAKATESIEILGISSDKALHCSNIDNQRILFAKEDGSSEVRDVIELVDSNEQPFDFFIDFNLFKDVFKHLAPEIQRVNFQFKSITDPLYLTDGDGLEGVIMLLRK